MFGSLGDLAGLMKQAKQMQSKMKEMQETLANARFEADSGAGAVTATVSGKLELVGLKISPSAVTDDVELLEDLVKSAVAAAQRKANEGVKAQMQQITGGMNLPGLEGMLGGQ
ncbi:MAG TPA: YbaB/EbfC family nucleoid-associated protein [Phycisphaerae bacterium]|nr:YbaB/EbfC family nucleoid-associated protein [Phycisphaerae bacterium]